MSIRSRLTHRCSTERDAEGLARDAFNQPITSVVVPLQSHPCYWQVQRESFIADGRKVMALASHFMLMPQGSDIVEKDRVTAVTDRKGRAFKSNKLRVMAVVRREDHLEIAMEEYS